MLVSSANHVYTGMLLHCMYCMYTDVTRCCYNAYLMCKPWGEGCPGVTRVFGPQGGGVILISYPDLICSGSLCCIS